MRYLLTISIVLLLSYSAVSQQKDVLFNRFTYTALEQLANDSAEHVHLSLKPVIESRVNTSTTPGFAADTNKYYYRVTKTLFGGHLVDIKGKDFRLIVDPQFDFSRGWEFKRSDPYTDTIRFYTNTRGFSISGDIGEKVSFQTRFYENLSGVPLYIWQRVGERGIFPGQGRPKNFKQLALDYAWAAGKVSWSPVEELNIQFGNDKNFVGHGYRSVLLSDNSFNYPFIKASALLFNGKVQYSSIFAKLTINRRLPTGQSSESLFYWKRATFQHLSVDLGKLELALFEATHWETIDSNGVKPLRAMEWNPVIGLNAASNGFSNVNKQLIGIDAKFKVNSDMNVYAQYATDNPAENRKAYQIGMRVFDLLGTGYGLQLEYNSADPFMYTNTPSRMSHRHLGQAMAHPLGADFSEIVVIADKRFGNWITRAKVNVATIHSDSLDTENYGNSLFKPTATGSENGKPLEHQLIFVDTGISYLLNPAYNMMVSAGYRYRDLTNTSLTASSSYLYFAFHTSLFNKYYDF